MTGTLQQGNTTFGLVKAPDGGLFRVRLGNYAGQSFGQIVAITETEIRLTEYVESNGDWETRTRSLHLAE